MTCRDPSCDQIRAWKAESSSHCVNVCVCVCVYACQGGEWGWGGTRAEVLGLLFPALAWTPKRGEVRQQIC